MKLKLSNTKESVEKEWDHKKLGRELDLFTFSDTVGKGLPLWTPKGAAIRRTLERFIVDEEIKRGYQHVYTPDIAKLDLYKKSGHYPYYKDSMYAPIIIEDEEFMLRPMTCPHHFELFLDKPRSYRDLPIRYAELAKLYRFEKSGELMGLQRVRSFCLADAHIICTKEQAKSEIKNALELIDYCNKVLGLIKDKDYSYRLSLGDRKDEKKYFKDDKSWDEAEEILRSVLIEGKSKYKEAEGEAAFYGPKIDIQMVNANGKEDTAFTVQYDFVMPKRFKLEFINEDGGKTEAVVVHRSSIGAIERIIAFLIEKYKGSFPTWLSPVQVKILPISEKHLDYSEKIFKELTDEKVRVELDTRNETLGAKIRDAQKEKVPYMIIVGDKEIENNEISIRNRTGKNSTMQLSKFIDIIKSEIENYQ
ncbi:MAG: Threonine-tRNA ligase [Candidatus Woesebacteria bacterium GW2011_GWA1_33_30]|uniref:Threonine--tRNA ligase n=1 Tax=Candidatus Woesebacteria bacterium GW2011_GWA2_33_28 TaxID=1618561 RepID=A0A0G0CXJ9_9BACT|nr:MAG: Threonine-tRNA ligase [Candidatus Woesebacteria bacterium GW2011_GWA2_33_28]KKP48900.1 MAG: Threonine-tRNA ligase [Candidatus Woesebacteria bacterium GW2011_GWA1_33_30]KKP50173.1 MAG: Threonine-tRNA ligase [Microgenomates group bacterium GW2011_GWC1_33_32]KKP51943.1 MAG: Threonine-tRNA ligase [Candidatus Woesebacteria bacterium GW2011_GWB1_33_38]KKP58269.1 MAG: Threonine-tRNA ligase [Microgenomates group bacterium GW2011_GWD1_33_9]